MNKSIRQLCVYIAEMWNIIHSIYFKDKSKKVIQCLGCANKAPSRLLCPGTKRSCRKNVPEKVPHTSLNSSCLDLMSIYVFVIYETYQLDTKWHYVLIDGVSIFMDVELRLFWVAKKHWCLVIENILGCMLAHLVKFNAMWVIYTGCFWNRHDFDFELLEI